MSALKEILLKRFDNLKVSNNLSELLTSFILVLMWILIGFILISIVKQVLFKVFKIKERGPRALTIGKLTSSISKYVIWFIISMIILSELEIDVTPFIASAGVIGLAIGFEIGRAHV